ncbi:MAG TPA: hypothetical protein VLC46_14260 [Thermoanaerobaculia bacterium]|jgi:hypothetical protein|nr:hypothetical protein [Thermoanaerobaculia bacterium]
MKRLLIPTAFVALVLTAGCKSNSSSTTGASGNTDATSVASASSLSPEDLGTLGAQIKKTPNEADRILADHGLNAQSFAAAVRKVSENPADARRYATAYKRAT